MTTSVLTPNYVRRKGICEICGKRTHLLAWNRTFSEWDFICRSCQEELGTFDLDSDREDDWGY